MELLPPSTCKQCTPQITAIWWCTAVQPTHKHNLPWCMQRLLCRAHLPTRLVSAWGAIRSYLAFVAACHALILQKSNCQAQRTRGYLQATQFGHDRKCCTAPLLQIAVVRPLRLFAATCYGVAKMVCQNRPVRPGDSGKLAYNVSFLSAELLLE